MSEQNLSAEVTTDEAQTSEATNTQANSETPSNEPSVDVDGVIAGWGEDRKRVEELEQRNFELEQKLSQSNQDDDDLDEDERVERRVQQKLKAKEDETAFAHRRAESQANYLKKTDLFFRNNEKRVIEFAIAGNISLHEANAQLKKRDEALNNSAEENLHADRKKNAGTSPSTESGSTVERKPYDPKADKDKSIEDLYMEGLQ